jgi:flavin reductase (DIM6/NTAB) family NADH-FMN oxidoreductase RutF
MLLVTTRHGDEPAGCLVGFSTQTSMEPIRYLVCLSRKNFTTRIAEQAEHLAVHLIGADQLDLVRLFGENTQDCTDKFTRCEWRPGPYGTPLLHGCPAWMVGRVLSRSDVGDHIAVLLEPVAGSGPGSPDALRYSQLPSLSPGHEA